MRAGGPAGAPSETADVGDHIFGLAAEIFPICRSITGDGVRRTLEVLSRHIQLQVHEVPTGTRVFDWTVPQEWNIREAWIRDPGGRVIVDMRTSNLHVLNYSEPVHARLPLAELRKRVHTIPDAPALIPYKTSYYDRRWGFCMAQEQYEGLPDGDYEVLIDSTLEDGSMTYGEYLHEGELADEMLFTAHVCHPSLANDNCSGVATLAMLAALLSSRRTRYSYRFLFAPGTIGSIAWLARNEDGLDRIKHGLVVSCVGDGGGPTYKKSRRGNAFIDRAMVHLLRHGASSPEILDFFPFGYDERQFCSPGFDLPVGLFQRSRFGTFPEYHTSADNLDLISPENLASSFRILADVVDVIERDWHPIGTVPKCEPQLGRRGLYEGTGGLHDTTEWQMALLWALNLADGRHSTLDIAERAGLPFALIADAADALLHNGLLTRT
jgi:aminopeptidase-like protein